MAYENDKGSYWRVNLNKKAKSGLVPKLKKAANSAIKCLYLGIRGHK